MNFMKKLFTLLAFLLMVGTASAQFTEGTKYVGASVSGLGLSYSKDAGFRFGLQATAGYFIADGFMVKANLGYDHTKVANDFSAGVGGRYYFTQNGIFLGAGAELTHTSPNFNSVSIPVEVGYCFYLNHYLSIEPSVYYKASLTDFADKSTVGLRIGLGYYF